MLGSNEKFTKLDWEVIERNQMFPKHSNHKDMIRRAKVPDGWLIESVKRFVDREQAGYGVGLTFIPDPNHEWQLEK
ncbi:MAG: hypothetical protein ACTSSB_17050 [Candidatus Heimdallarchaeota archaeon]